MPLAQLISPQQLAERLQEPQLRLLDCRFALENPTYGRRSYAEGHIPGAHYADLEEDLSGPVSQGVTGRHPLPEPDQLIARLRSWGVDEDCLVVLYDDGPGAFAARAWWLLTWLGKRDGVYLLDGGLKAWRDAQLPLSTELPEPTAGHFAGSPDDSLIVDAERLLATLEAADQPLLDARALPRFCGEVEPIDPVAGHIPGATCVPFTDNLAADGRFLSPDQLRQRFTPLLKDCPGEQAIAYCGSGVTACHNLFALCLAGYPLGRLYPGSWSEWITDTRRPIA